MALSCHAAQDAKNVVLLREMRAIECSVFQEPMLSGLSITRRRFLWSAVGSVAALAGVTAVGTNEANHPQLSQLDVFLPNLPDSFDLCRIALLTDFHYDSHFSRTPIDMAIKIVNELRPDLVILGGDYVTAPALGGLHRSSKVPDADPCASLLSGLRALSGVFGVLGNHDEYFNVRRIIDPLQSAGIRILRNQAFPVERDGKRLWLAGISDILAGEPDLDKTLSGIPSGETTALLCHEPDFADHVMKYPVDLQLSGHSHGGQVRLPLVGALYLPAMGRKYPCGVHRLGRLTLYTNRGIGTLHLPLRLDCPPEVTLLTLRCGTRPPQASAAMSYSSFSE